MNGFFGLLGVVIGLGAIGCFSAVFITRRPSIDPESFLKCAFGGNEQLGRVFLFIVGLICLVVFIVITLKTDGLPIIRNLF